MRCCTIKLKRSWSYCPGCGEEIEWPPTRAQLLERAARQVEHQRRMATEPDYAWRYESAQRLYNWTLSEEIRQYADQDDPFMGLTEAAPVLRGEDKDVAV